MKRIYSALEKQYGSKETLNTVPTLETNLTQNQSNLLSNVSHMNNTNNTNNSYSLNLLNKTSGNKTFQTLNSKKTKTQPYPSLIVTLYNKICNI